MNMNHVIELLKRAELYDEAAAVGLVMQQRAELLEALKEIITSVDKGQCVMLDKAREAITKAEAAE